MGRTYLPRTARPAQSRRMRAGVPPRRVARGPYGFPGRFAARRRERPHGRVHAALPCAAFSRERLPASPCGGTHALQLGLRSPSERPPVHNNFPSKVSLARQIATVFGYPTGDKGLDGFLKGLTCDATRGGCVAFFAAVPDGKANLVTDIVNCHHKDYYAGT